MPMARKPFVYLGTAHDLSHLEAFQHIFVEAALGNKPEQRYPVLIHFGHHCFTRSRDPHDDPSLAYPSSQNDPRSFDLLRWELSKHLPGVVRDLISRKIYHTGHGNFLTIELTADSGIHYEYEVYFDIRWVREEKRHHLTVSSAFPRDPARIASRPKPRSMRFALILFNTKHGKPVRVQH
jgi:hypothetical protein